MSSRHLLRIVLHLLLAAGLVLPGIAAPAQAVSLLAASTTGGMAHAACDGMAMPMPAPMPSHGKPPPVPAGMPHACDLAGCLGAGCLPTLPHVAAFVPDADSLIAWDQPLPPSRLVETLLRPPIA